MNYLSILSNHLKKNRDRSKSFHVLKAAMSGAALVATADGIACARESRRTKELIKSLDALALYDPGLGLRIYMDTVNALNKNQKKGTASALEAVLDVKDEPENAAMVVMMCQAVSEADGHIDGAEKASIDRITKELGISGDDVRRFAHENDARPTSIEGVESLRFQSCGG